MKKIDEFQITGMTISGFKSYQKRTDLVFGNPTIITGGNGQGKSSIADAIAFAITGLPFYGEHGLDRLHNEVNPDVFVQLRFVDGQGISHELTRTRQKSRTTIVLDGYEIRQLDLSDIFGERDVFLSIFNPLYFIEELGESGKNLLSRYLPAIHQKDILAQLSEPVRERLEKEDILSPDAFLKAKREEIRQLAENIIYLNGQRDQALTQNQIRKEKLAGIPQRHDALKTELSALETKRFAGMDIPAVKERLAELTTQYSESRIDCQNDAQQMQVQLNALREKIAARQAEPYQPKYTEALAEAQTKLGVLAAQYNWEGQTFQSLAAGKDCPVCHRPVTEAMLPEIQDKVKRTAAALLADGQKMQQHIQEITALEQKSQEAFNRFRADDLLKLKSEMDTISEQCRKLDSEAAAQAADLRAQIQLLDMDLKYGTLTQAEYERLQQCREECQQCEAELNALRSLTDQDLTVFDRQIEQTEKDINELKKLLADVAIYASKRAEMMFSALKLNRVEISLYNVVKSTGELKDTFKFNYNGRRYDRLSLSEKIRAGMEVSQLVMRLMERKYPVFIDNMESVDDLENVRPVSQIIFSKCVSKTSLQVRPVQPIGDHGPGKYHLSLNTDTDQFRCNLCGTSGNSVTLYARMKGISNKQAYQELSEESKVYLMPRQPVSRNTEREPADLKLRHAAYSDMLEHLTLLNRHRENLLGVPHLPWQLDDKRPQRFPDTSPKQRRHDSGIENTSGIWQMTRCLFVSAASMRFTA